MKEHITTIYSLLDIYVRRDVHGHIWEFFDHILCSDEYATEEYKGEFPCYVRLIPDVFTALFELRNLLGNYALTNLPDDSQAGAQKINGQTKDECFHLNNIYYFYDSQDGKFERFQKNIEKWYPIYLKSKTSADCRMYDYLSAKTFKAHFMTIIESVFKLDPIMTSGTFRDLDEEDYHSNGNNSYRR